MDPLSITVSCFTLLGVTSKTSLAITTFIRGCRDARSDLATISGELTQLQLVLELLKDDTNITDYRVIPEHLQNQILAIIDNCSEVVDKINQVLQKYTDRSGPAKWTLFGKTEVEGLRMSLEAHRGSLSLVFELVSASLSKAIKDDTSAMRTDFHEIRQDSSHIPRILAELARLRSILAGSDTESVSRHQDDRLERYLESLTTYAESVCDDSDIADHPSRRHQDPHSLMRTDAAEAEDQIRLQRGPARIAPSDAGSRLSWDTIRSADSALTVDIERPEDVPDHRPPWGDLNLRQIPPYRPRPERPSDSPPPGQLPTIVERPADLSSLGQLRLIPEQPSYTPPPDKRPVRRTGPKHPSDRDRVAPPLPPGVNLTRAERPAKGSTLHRPPAVSKDASLSHLREPAGPRLLPKGQLLVAGHGHDSAKWKIVVVGDQGVGKTSLIKAFVLDHPLESISEPTYIFDGMPPPWVMNASPDGKPNTAYIITFAVDSRESFNNITAEWLPRIRQYTPTSPLILIGLKVDTRRDARPDPRDPRFISWDEGVSLANRIGAARYYDEMALDQTEIAQRTFRTAASLLFPVRPHSQRSRLLEDSRNFFKAIGQRYLGHRVPAELPHEAWARTGYASVVDSGSSK